MPYIESSLRPAYDEHINKLIDAVVSTSPDKVDIAGNLNYCITRLMMGVVMKKFGKIRYWMSPLLRGVLKDVGDEMYRRVFHKYEDEKINSNGDVPEYAEIERQRVWKTIGE